jgi:hypothetical protein
MAWTTQRHSHWLPLPLARVLGWGTSAPGLPAMAENVPAWREPSPAALCERVGLSRKRERQGKPANSPRRITHAIALE